MKLHQLLSLRKLALPLLAKLGPGDITIQHHYTGHPFHLHAFKHKGYWYHGKNRERSTMDLFQLLIQPGDAVIEVGGHIGYISLYFSQLVGSEGRVYVLEPGTNNLPYIEKNIHDLDNIRLGTTAISNFTGTAPFFVENLTGQNNSLNSHYTVFQQNLQRAFSTEQYDETVVDVITMDSFLQAHNISADFVKIDIEGAELSALQGMKRALKVARPMLMVEITQSQEDVYKLLMEFDYILFTENLTVINSYHQILGNTFCLHKDAHEKQLAEIFTN